MLRQYKIRYYDFKLVILVIALAVIGIIALGSAEPALQNRQIAGFAFGLFLMLVISLFDYSVMAGVGDSFFWGTLKLIAAGVGIALASQGNIMGPILFFLIINVPHFILRYLCLDKGFQYGTQFFKDISSGGIITKITEAATMLGLMVIGGMTAANVSFSLAINVGSGDWAESVQSYLDQIMPGLLPAVLFGIMYWLLGKKVKTTTILIAVMVLCIILSGIGVV